MFVSIRFGFLFVLSFRVETNSLDQKLYGGVGKTKMITNYMNSFRFVLAFYLFISCQDQLFSSNVYSAGGIDKKRPYVFCHQFLIFLVIFKVEKFEVLA